MLAALLLAVVAMVHGTVVYDGAPAPGVTVSIGAATTLTDAKGQYATATPIAQFPVKPRLIRRLDPLANRHYVIDLDGQVTLLDTSAMPPAIVAALVVGAAPSVALVDPAARWLIVFDRRPPFDARLYKVTSGTVTPADVMLVRLTAPVNDAVMLP